MRFIPILALLALGACSGDPIADCRNATFAVIGAQTVFDTADKYANAHPTDTGARDKADLLSAALDAAIATKLAVCPPPVI